MTRSYFPVVNEDGVLPRMLFLLFVKGRDDCPKELARELDLWLGGSLIVHSNNMSLTVTATGDRDIRRA